MAEQPPVLVEYPLIGGVDQKTDPRKMDATKLVTATNAQIDKTGVLTKRYGTTSQGIPLAAGSRPASYAGSHLIAMTAGDIRTKAPGFSTWFTKDLLPEVTDVIQRTVAASNLNAYDANLAYESTSNSNGTITYAWRTNVPLAGSAGDVYALVADAVTGQVLSGPTRLTSSANAFNPKVVCLGGTAIVTWDDNGGNIVGRTCPVGTFPHAWTAAANIVTDNQTTNPGVYDICPVNATRFMLAYETFAVGVATCVVDSVTSALAVASSALLSDAGADRRECIAVHSTVGERAWVAYYYVSGGNDVVRAAATTDGTGTVTETIVPFTASSSATVGVVSVGVVRYSSTTASVIWNTDVATMRSSVVNTSSAVVGTNRETWGISLASKPFVNGTKVFCLVYALPPDGDSPQGTTFLIDVNADDTSTALLRARPVAIIAPRTSPRRSTSLSYPLQGSALPAVVTDGSSRARTVSSVVQNVASSTLLTVSDVAFTFDYKKRMSAELGGLLYTSGGIVQWYDGTRSAEASFLTYPCDALDFSLTKSNGAGALTNLGVYGYKAIFVQRDAQGNIHRSESSVAMGITMGAADDTVTVTLPAYPFTLRQDAANGYSPVGVELYRTTAGGTVYFRLNDEPLPSTLTNVTTGIFLATYTDLASDASLSGKQILYTFGSPVGELGNVCPPSASILCTHRERLWLAGCPNRKEIWASKRHSVGEAPGWNEGLTFTIDDGGDITGLASMDDKLIVFKEDKIFYITGDGPDPTGNNSDWSDPIRIVTTVGCIEPRSVVMTPMGVAYQSRVGLSLLTRGLEVIPDWGQEVSDEVSSFPTVTSALLHKTRMEVRFTCDSGANGSELRYDYRTKQWFTARYHESGGSRRIVGACTVGSDYYWTNPGTGSVFKENTASYLDNAASYVAMTLEFADFRGAGTQGYQNVNHVMVYADYHTPHEFYLEYAIDNGSYVVGKQWTAANLATLTRQQLDFHPPQTKNQAIRVRLSDTTPSSGSVGSGRGFSLVSLAFEGSPKQGRQRNLSSTAKG